MSSEYWVPFRENCLGVEMEGQVPKKKPEPRMHVAIPRPSLKKAQSFFSIPLPLWKPSILLTMFHLYFLWSRRQN